MPPKLRGDAPPSASGRRWRYIGTQMAIHRDVVGGTLGHALKGRVASSKYMINEGGMLVIRDKDARDSGQLLFFREKCCIFALSFIKNGKWEINH